jgi:transposase-like protein
MLLTVLYVLILKKKQRGQTYTLHSFNAPGNSIRNCLAINQAADSSKNNG